MTAYTGMVFEFERRFSLGPTVALLRAYWWMSFPIGALYYALMRLGERSMADRAPFKLTTALLTWNALLAVFSAAALSRCSAEMWHALADDGLTASVCTHAYSTTFAAYWIDKFAYSKLFELGDTAFLVLRKRPVNFLHWYHHITVMVYTWHSMKDETIAGRWFIWMNLFAHTLMYTYYALSAARRRLPKFISMAVTTVQIVQMFVGCCVAVIALYVKLSGGYCQQTYQDLCLCFLMYSSYICLFLRFFSKAYLSATTPKYSAKIE